LDEEIQVRAETRPCAEKPFHGSSSLCPSRWPHARKPKKEKGLGFIQ
jgi:hypothetical protein